MGADLDQKIIFGTDLDQEMILDTDLEQKMIFDTDLDRQIILGADLDQEIFDTDLEQEMVFGESLDGFEQIGAERQFVAEFFLAVFEEGVIVADRLAQRLRLRLVLAVVAVNLEFLLLEHITHHAHQCSLFWHNALYTMYELII